MSFRDPRLPAQPPRSREHGRDLHKDLKAPFVIAYPPFNDSDWHRADGDVRWANGLPPLLASRLARRKTKEHNRAP